ncbi:MAG: hypothetical protein D6772_04695 [Bacteroidetes bacterium]|nr:MAG: hypothetical protein D6772_04695 [Bacteroidota bacterium]
MKEYSSDSLREDLGEMLGYMEIYADRRLKLAKLAMAEKVARFTSALMSSLVLLLLVLLGLTIFSIGLAYWLADQWALSYATSFFIMAAGYAVLGGVIYLLRHQLFTNPILNTLLDDDE